jgi:hypothetical protein
MCHHFLSAHETTEGSHCATDAGIVFVLYTDVREVVVSQPIGSYPGQDNHDVSLGFVFMHSADSSAAIVCEAKCAIIIL